MSLLPVLTALAVVGSSLPPGLPAPVWPTAVDSLSTFVANRVVLDIAAPASLIWTWLPSIRKRPDIERVSLNGLVEQFGARNDFLYRDSTGRVYRHDRVEVLHWEPGVRYVAKVEYLPPADAVTIIYHVDLREAGGVTRFVMDSYSTVTIAVSGTEAERVAQVAAARKGYQDAVEKGYQAFKTSVEAAARK